MTMLRFFYLDASALAKRYAPENGSGVVNHLFAQVKADRLIVLNIGMAEVVSILVRKRNSGKLTVKNFAQAIIDFDAEITNTAAIKKIVAITPLVISALALIERHSINSTDAVLLRSALDLAADLRSSGNDLVLVASDHRLLRAAQAEGLSVFNPETQTIIDLDQLII